MSCAASSAEFDRSAGRALYGTDPAAYAAGRPEYPEAIYEVLRHRCHLRDGTRVLEIGPGTGLVTRRTVSLGAVVTCIEPNVALAAFLRQTMPDANLNVVVSAFEDATLPDGAFDLAVAATSFHWVDQRVGLAKLRRVLRPGGHVAIWWMLFDDPTTVDSFDVALESVLGPAVQIVEPGRPPFQLDTEARCAHLRRAGFDEVRSDILHTEYRFDADSIRALYATMAIVLQRPTRQRAHVLDAVQALVERDFDGAIARSFVTALYTARAPAVSKM